MLKLVIDGIGIACPSRKKHSDTFLVRSSVIGHWLGLLNVFPGGTCDTDNDGIADTSRHKTATDRFPVVQNSCPSYPGVGTPIANFLYLKRQ